MDYPRALEQIAEIHQQIAKGEIYRGYRSAPIAASGIVGFVAAAMQPAVGHVGFLEYWAAIAAAAAVVGLSEVAYNYVVRDHASGRRRTRQVLGQFLPGTIAAAVVTVAASRLGPPLVAVLPGIWALCFGVGIFASRPYLPRGAVLVAGYFLAAGAALLWTADLSQLPSGWEVGGTFGIGQLLGAAVLYWELERSEGASQS